MEINQVGLRILAIIQADMDTLMDRLQSRSEQSILIFSQKRRREHFAHLFRNRFESATLTELSYLPEPVLTVLQEFYQLVDNLKWYLENTEDMPNTAAQELTSQIYRLRDVHILVHQQASRFKNPANLTIVKETFEEGDTSEVLSQAEPIDQQLSFPMASPEEMAVKPSETTQSQEFPPADGELFEEHYAAFNKSWSEAKQWELESLEKKKKLP